MRWRRIIAVAIGVMGLTLVVDIIVARYLHRMSAATGSAALEAEEDAGVVVQNTSGNGGPKVGADARLYAARKHRARRAS